MILNRTRAWMTPLTGLAFFAVLVIGFAVGGSPKAADEPVEEIVSFYLDNKAAVQVGAILGVLAGLLLIIFGAYLRKVLEAAADEEDVFPLVAFAGLLTVAIAFAIDGTILFAAAEAADDIDPVGVQVLQAIFDNDFLPIVLGVAAFLWGTGLSAFKSGVLPKWLAGLMILFGVIAFTPIGFISAIAAAVLVLVLSIMLTMRARAAASSV